jgi:uncharacterized RDD family membrane protein YckC
VSRRWRGAQRGAIVDESAAMVRYGPPHDNGAAAAPSLRRRMACFVYEGVLLFGVVMIAGYLYSSLTQQRHALVGLHGLQAFLFVVLGIYFVWFWSNGGQTVAMKTWHVRVLTADGRPLSQWRALARYFLSWLWFLPALASAHFVGLGAAAIGAVLFSGVVVYAALSRFHPQRQFVHDMLCGTRLVSWRSGPRKTA